LQVATRMCVSVFTEENPLTAKTDNGTAYGYTEANTMKPFNETPTRAGRALQCYLILLPWFHYYPPAETELQESACGEPG
jgi:hypothetical protein